MVLAFRNLFRHRRRSLTAFSSVTFGVIALLLAGGFIEWAYWAGRQGVIESRLGNIQIARPGYFEGGFAKPFDYLMPETSTVIDAVRKIPGVEVVTPRLAFTGLISYGNNTISFMGEGVVPQTEARVSRQLTMISGRDLASRDDKGVILGEGLNRNLGAKIGDRVVLLSTKPNGGINAIEVTVRGIFHTTSESFDNYALRVPLPLAQRLVNVSGVHSWVVLLNNTEQTDQVLKYLQANFTHDGSGAIKFTPWYQLADFYNKTVALFSRQMNILKAMIAIIIVLSLSNTMVANVLERTGEIGTLLALGCRRRRIVGLFVSEGMLIGLLGAVAGLAFGWVLAQIISALGLHMPPAPGTAFGFDAKIFVTPEIAAGSLLLSVVTSTVASFYPAWRASRLVIVDALRHNR